MHLFCDESGNTGVDLFNAQQPVFSIGSTSISRELATELLQPLLKRGQKEVKFSSLKNSRDGRQRLLSLFSSDYLSTENCGFTLVDKKFYVISHLVDKLIEPPLHEAGIDLYARDAHVSLARLWYYTGHTIFVDGHWKKVLEAFVQVLRRLDQTSFDRFDAVLDRAYQAAAEESRDFAAGVYIARGRLNEFLGVYEHKEVFDPAVDGFIYLVQKWMARNPGVFALTHDRSKPLKHREAFLRELMTPAAPRIIGYGDRQSELPLRLSSLQFGDSQQLPQLQVADILAGSAIDALHAWSGVRQPSDYHDKLKHTKFESFFLGGILPTLDLEPTDPPKSGEVSLPEGAAQFFQDIGYIHK